jgi:hypothetical protein
VLAKKCPEYQRRSECTRELRQDVRHSESRRKKAAQRKGNRDCAPARSAVFRCRLLQERFRNESGECGGRADRKSSVTR